MRVLVGLGNPGERYKRNRHNVGFMVVDEIMRRHESGLHRLRFHRGVGAGGRIGDERVLLIKPDTYMNESGQAVAEQTRFYRLEPADVIVFHDELDLAPGKMRVKIGGSDAGHNGLRSITAHIGSEYKRVRIGIGHPGHKDLVHDYVLNDFAKSERPWVETLCDVIADNAGLLVAGADSSFRNKVHLAMQAKGFGGTTSDADTSD
jgi:peptidyl-tRNA hydrolase, PTH1 family